jgi:hypothetical protein
MVQPRNLAAAWLGVLALAAPAAAASGAGAGAGAAGAAAAAAPPAKPVTTAFVFAEGAAAARRAEVLGALEEELTVREGIVFRAFATLLGDEDATYDKEREGAVGRCAEARAVLDELDIERALPDLQSCVTDLEGLVGLADVGDELYEAEKALALAAYLDGDEKRAVAALRQALVLVPDTGKLDPKSFPKKMKPLVDELLLNFELDRGAVEIVVDAPGAEVYLNGVLAGVAPVKLEGLYYGRNYLTVRAPGRLPWVGTLKVDAPALAPYRVTLPAPRIDVGDELEALRTHAGDPAVPKGAAGLRRKLDVDQIVVGLLAPAAGATAGGEVVLKLFAYDLRSGTRAGATVAELPGGDHLGVGSAVEGLGVDLAAEPAAAAGSTAPKPSGPGPLAKMTAGLGKLGHSPIFWGAVGGGVVLVGVVVAIAVIAGAAGRGPIGGWYVGGL